MPLAARGYTFKGFVERRKVAENHPKTKIDQKPM